MKNMSLLKYKEIENLSVEEREIYYQRINSYLQNSVFKAQTNTLIIGLIAKIAPFLRSFQLEIRGEENIPHGDSVIFCVIIPIRMIFLLLEKCLQNCIVM